MAGGFSDRPAIALLETKPADIADGPSEVMVDTDGHGDKKRAGYNVRVKKTGNVVCGGSTPKKW